MPRLTSLRPLWLAALAPALLLTSCPSSPSSFGTPTVEIRQPAEDCICIQPGESVTFEATATEIETFVWTGTPQINGTMSTQTSPITFPDKGVFTITATASTPTEEAIDQVKVIVRDNCEPLTAVIAAPEDGTEFGQGSTVPFDSVVTGGDAPYTFAWSFETPDRVDSTLDADDFTYLNEGDFTVTLVVTDAVGDTATTTIDLTIFGLPDELLPGPRSLPISGPDGFALVRGTEWAGQTAEYILAIAHGAGVNIFDPVEEQTLEDEFDAEGIARVGTVPLLAQGADGPVSALLRYGSSTSLAHYREGEWDLFQLSVNGFSFVTDALAFGDELEADGLVTVSGGVLTFLRFDPVSEFFQIEEQINRATVDSGSFESMVGVYPDASGEDYLVVFGGSPGTLYSHDRSTDPGVVIGQVGDTPRKVRCRDGIFVVTNFGSDDLTIGTWDGSTGAITATAPVGDGPIGTDLLALPEGGVAAVSTGFNDDTVTVTVIDAVGAIVSNVTTALPAGSSQPAHALWARDLDNRIFVTAFGDDVLQVVDSGL